MAGLIESVANANLDLLLGTPGLLPATVYIGLMTAAPNGDGTGVVEPVGFGYARVSVVNNPANWPAAVARRKVHANDIAFAAASGGSWGLITWAGVFDAASGGALRLAAPLATPRLIMDTDAFRFLALTTPLAFTIPWS